MSYIAPKYSATAAAIADLISAAYGRKTRWLPFKYACGHPGRIVASKVPTACLIAKCWMCEKTDRRVVKGNV